MTNWTRFLLFWIGICTLAACGGRDNVVEEFGPEALYETGSESLLAGNYPNAISYFQALAARFPFSNVTRQAQLDMIYAYYKGNQFESAIDAANEFEAENPTHPRVDYCLYMKGLIHFDKAPNWLEKLFRVDLTERPPRETMLAFSDFQELIRRFPDSEYVPDARDRMIFLRNRLATYENHVARYYIEREAFVAAINRAKYAIEHYPGAPALEESLGLLAEAYDRLGIADLAEDARRVQETTFGENL
ncbi:MAG: outer membrane protein assembly factor BamD [Pseudomonadota bacterium]|nr:outer membrane protein assembly factor BamD [Pseudomonadota bacterium]